MSVSKHTVLLEELRKLGVRDVIFRARYELSKKIGFVERKHRARKLSAEDVMEALDLENPSLADVRRACDSRRYDLAVAEMIKHFKSRESPRFFFDPEDRGLYQRLLRDWFSDQVSTLVEHADRICQHKFDIFGSSAVEFGDEVNWHIDPSTGRDWHRGHWSRIDIRGADRVGDVKFTWELNRHQFFFVLGRAYWFTGDQKYAREFASLVRGWIDANPPETGVNWYSNLEIAIRLISWVWAYYYFLDSPYFGDDLHFDFLRTILQSCQHITRDFQYSLRSMKNNHVIGDATALAFAGIMFPEFRQSKLWRDTYIDILYRELDRQVYNDGTDFEQSISYHRFVLYFYLLLFRIMQINGYDVPAGFAQKLEKMVEFLMYVMKPDKTMPHVGDCDDARVLRLSNDELSDLTSTLSTGAVLFRRGDFKWAAGRLSEETFWLNGEESPKIFDSLAEFTPPTLSRRFRDGGYYVMRTDWDADARYLLFKCGKHANHGHADSLHVEMYCNGKSYLRDCGTYTYNGPLEWRTFFRSTQAHNTVVVDGESQSIPYRVFRWLKTARSSANTWVASRNFDYVDAEHDGYSRYKDPVIHRRAVLFVKPEYWVIVDRLTGHGKHSVELLFHTPRGEHRLNKETKVFQMQGLAIVPVTLDDIDVSLREGWFSPCYGTKEPSVTVAYKFTGDLPRIIATVLFCGEGDSLPLIQCDFLSHTDERLAMNMKLRGFCDTLIFNPFLLKLFFKKLGGSQRVDTDAEIAFLRENEASGKIERIALVNGRYLRLEGKTLVEEKSPVESIDLVFSHEEGIGK